MSEVAFVSELAGFQEFPKIPRLSRNMVITEKIDGTNAAINIAEDGSITVQSRNRLITPESDNYGFARWVSENAEMLRRLGPGRHFGEWWGSGIQRRYDLSEKRFSLFNVGRWEKGLPEGLPSNVHVVPILREYTFDTGVIAETLEALRVGGSVAAPGFMQPEGIIIYHTASRQLWKKTIEGDEKPKGSKE